ncbi:MAG: NRDE family protein [Bradymonadaceae bacterium]
MCTIILRHDTRADASILVGVNRDEYRDRPSAPPDVREGEAGGRFFAPRDRRAGGTWLGINSNGVFAALTNRFGARTDEDRNSRGELVPLCLAEPDAASAAAALEEVQPRTYNAFHLVVADPDGVFVAASDGRRCSVARGGTDLYVVTERSVGAADNPRKAAVRTRCRELQTENRLSPQSLQRLLSRPCGPPSESVCVDVADGAYGTCSSVTARFGPGTAEWQYADGPPCETAYQDQSDELARLLQTGGDDRK